MQAFCRCLSAERRAAVSVGRARRHGNNILKQEFALRLIIPLKARPCAVNPRMGLSQYGHDNGSVTGAWPALHTGEAAPPNQPLRRVSGGAQLSTGERIDLAAAAARRGRRHAGRPKPNSAMLVSSQLETPVA